MCNTPLVHCKLHARRHCCLTWIVCGQNFSRQKPRSPMPRKTLEKSGLELYDTESPSRSEALRFIDSAKCPSKKPVGSAVLLISYCKSRIFRTHSIFVSWALRPFVRMKFSYSRWPLRILWLALYLSHAFYFRMEAAAYEIYRPYFSRPRK